MAGSTYTFAQKPAPTEPGQESNFGGMSVDANHNAMTGNIGSGPQTNDISGTPVVSPVSVSNSAVTTLTIPLNATQLFMLATSNTVNISEQNGAVTDHYFTIPTGVQVEVDVSRVKQLYLKANVGASTLSFWFNVI